MARLVKLPKFRKPEEKVTTPATAPLATAPSTEALQLPCQLKKSQVLPKAIQNTGRHIKQLFKQLKKNRHPLYLQVNKVFCNNREDDIIPVVSELESNVGVTDGNTETLSGSENVTVISERAKFVDKGVQTAPPKIEADEGIQQDENPHLLSTVTETNFTIPHSNLSGVFETADISSRTCQNVLSLGSPVTSIEITPQLYSPFSSPNNFPSQAPAQVTSALLSIDKASAPQNTRSTRTNQTLTIDFAVDTAPNTEVGAAISSDIAALSQNLSGSGTSIFSVENGSVIDLSRAQHTRGFSNATTLKGSMSRSRSALTYDAALMPRAEFRKQLDQQYQLLAGIQGQRDERAVQQDQDNDEDRALGIDAGFQDNEANRERTALEEQAKIYDALLEKAKQDREDALAERQELHDDVMKYIRRDLETAQDEARKLKVVQKELDAAQSRKEMFEKRLRKVLGQQETAITENRALIERCKALEDDVALKDEQLRGMLSTLQNRQEELQTFTGRYHAAQSAAIGNARLVEENGLNIQGLRQHVQLLTGQLTQYQQAPAAALVNDLRNENDRLLGVVAEDRSRLGTATAQIFALTEALRQAKREHDRWFTEMPEHSLSNPTKIANHLAYKDKLYEDLEKRFQDYTTVNEEKQKKARAYEDEAEQYINALIKALEMQNEAVNKAKKDKEAYLSEMSRILTTSLDQLQQEELIKGLSFHFDLVQKDNFALATRVTQLGEEVDGLKEEVTGRAREQKSLVKELEAQRETANRLEAEKITATGEIDAMNFNIEVAEEGHKEQVANYEGSLAELKSDLRIMGERFSEIIRGSASEQVRFDLEEKDRFIHTLKCKMNEIYQAWLQACNERDHFSRVSSIDICLASCTDRDVSFLQGQLHLSEEKLTKLQEDLDDVHLRNARDRRLSKEAVDEQKARVQDLEKQLHELYQNLQAKASQAQTATPADTPPRARSSEPTKENNTAIEDLAVRLWSCLRGLEIAIGAHGIRAVDHDNEREQIRLACEQLLGLRDDEDDGPPRSTTSAEASQVGDEGNDVPNAEDDGSNHNFDADVTPEEDTVTQLQGDYALAEALINDACDTLGYAPDHPFRAEEIQRSVYGRHDLGEAEGVEGSEDVPGLESSTEVVLGDEEDPDELEVGEGIEGGVGLQEAGHEVADDESSTTTTTADIGASSRADDDRTVTQEQYDAAAVTAPQHAEASAESAEDTAGTSPTDEDDPDDSMEMTPGTWARRYAPPFMYGEPIEDDMF